MALAPQFGVYGSHATGGSVLAHLNPADKSSAITLSMANLQATQNVTFFVSVRATAPKTTGKFYVEGTNVVNNTVPATRGVGLGLMNSTAVLGTGSVNEFPGVDTNGMSYLSTGNLWANGSHILAAPTWISAGAKAAMAVDIGARRFWARTLPSGNWNDDPSANPATGVGGVAFATGMATGAVYFAATAAGSDPETILINFGGSAFTGFLPAGFGMWTDP